jgi:hypothetical protein
MKASGTVYVIWWAMVLVALIVVVPPTVYLLHRLWQAARSIERYTADALAAGLGIAGNTAAISALDQTVRLGGELGAAAASIRQHSAAVETTLAGRA